MLARPRFALVVVAVALCCTSVAFQSPGRNPAVLTQAVDQHRTVHLTLNAAETVQRGQGSFAVHVIGVRVSNQPMLPVSVSALVFGADVRERIGIGSEIDLDASVVATKPGDEKGYLLFVRGPTTVVQGPPWYLAWSDDLRRGLARAAGQLPGDGGQLLAGLAIGDTGNVSDTLNTAMKASSLTHLTAVSGANCAVVIGLIMLAGGAVGASRRVRIAASIAVLIGFVVLVTPQPSVLRAALMALLVLVALAVGRPIRGLPVLSVAILLLLIVDPWLGRNYGFILSVLATAGLVLLAGPLAEALTRWIPAKLALVVAVPLAAQLTCQPVIILLNASVPTYGVIANMLAEPAAPVATVLGLAACIALPLIPALGVLLCQLAWLPSAWIAAVARFFAAAPLARLPWLDGAPGALLMALVSALLLGALLAPAIFSRWMALALAVLIVSYVGVTVGTRIAEVAGRPANWQIAVCDIGQGDAVLVRSAGKVALIDVGPKPPIMAACLTELGITHIDLLVLTHYDLDHVGGVDAVLGMVDRAFVGPTADRQDERIVAGLAIGGAEVERMSRGPTGMLGDLRWSILWPPVRLGDIEPGNPASITVQFTPVGACPEGCLSSIFLGDLGEDAQNRLMAANRLGPVDVVKVAHHGSADQSLRLYQRVHAVVGVIGVGATNTYGHPTQHLLDILASVGTQAERTDLSGMILLAPGGAPAEVSVWRQR